MSVQILICIMNLWYDYWDSWLLAICSTVSLPYGRHVKQSPNRIIPCIHSVMFLNFPSPSLMVIMKMLPPDTNFFISKQILQYFESPFSLNYSYIISTLPNLVINFILLNTNRVEFEIFKLNNYLFLLTINHHWGNSLKFHMFLFYIYFWREHEAFSQTESI